MRRRTILVLVGVLWIGFGLCECALADPSWTIMQLTNNSTEDTNPAISGKNVVWQGWDGHDYEVFLFDGQTTKQLTDNSYDDVLGTPEYARQVNSNGTVVWSGRTGGSSSGSEIFRYDASGVSQLTSNVYYDAYPQVNNSGQVAWVGYDASNPNRHIYSYDETGVHNVSADSSLWVAEEFELNADGNVAWSGAALDGTPGVFLKEGLDTTVLPLTLQQHGLLESLHLNDSAKMVWATGPSQSPLGREIFMYGDGIITQLTYNSSEDSFPDISNNGQVVWGNREDHAIFSYDGSTTKRIADFTGGWGQPKISDNGFVAWQGNDLGDAYDNKIWVYDGLTSTTLESGATNDRYHQINASGDVVWQAYDGSDYEIYLATFVPDSIPPDVIPVPGAALLGVIGLSFAGYRLRRQ